MRTRSVIACPHVQVCGHAGSLRVRIEVPCVRTSSDPACLHCSLVCADTQGHCVSTYSSVQTRKVTACLHNLTAMLTRNDLACPHVPVCGHAKSLRVRIVVLCMRTSRYLACPHCSPMYADTQKYCVSAHLYMRTRNDTACPHYYNGQYNHTKWLRADNNAIDRIYASSI